MEQALIQVAAIAAALLAIAMVATTALRGWQDWLRLKTLELDRKRETDAAQPSAVTRIEMADLKERLRKLEEIAAGVDI